MALTVHNKIILSWGDINDLVDELCKKIPFNLPLIDSVHGIPRGGLIPAVLISHKLGLPYVNTVGPNTLVIDDIADTGVTLEKSPGVYTAVLHYKPHTSCFIPQLWAKLHEGDEWVIYPWETKDSDPIQDYLKSDEFKEFADFVDNDGTSGTNSEEFGHLKDTSYIADITDIVDSENSGLSAEQRLKEIKKIIK